MLMTRRNERRLRFRCTPRICQIVDDRLERWCTRLEPTKPRLNLAPGAMPGRRQLGKQANVVRTCPRRDGAGEQLAGLVKQLIQRRGSEPNHRLLLADGH